MMFLKTAVKNLTRNTRRSIGIGVTVAVGTLSLFIFHGFNYGIMHQYEYNTIHSRYGHGQLNLKGYREQVFEKPWEHWIGDWEGVKRQLQQVPAVKHLFPRLEFFSLLTNGRVTVSGRGQGIDGAEESKFFNTLNIEAGETLGAQEDGILLGRGLARALDAKPGDRITVLVNTIHGSMNAADLYVTGIFHTGSKDFDDVVFRIPIRQAQMLLDTKLVESIAIGLDRTQDWTVIERETAAKFPGLEAVPFAILDKVYYQNSVDWLGQQFAVIEFIILAIVILGIFNSVSAGILERKQEIGNLRANGESAWDVMRLLILEGLSLGVLAALAGILLAWVVNMTLLKNGILMPPAPGLTRQFHVLIELQWMMALKTFAMGAGVAVIGTLIAAIRVIRMPIGEALRSI